MNMLNTVCAKLLKARSRIEQGDQYSVNTRRRILYGNLTLYEVISTLTWAYIYELYEVISTLTWDYIYELYEVISTLIWIYISLGHKASSGEYFCHASNHGD